MSDPTATISVTVDGNTYPATNNGDGTWTLANEVFTSREAKRLFGIRGRTGIEVLRETLNTRRSCGEESGSWRSAALYAVYEEGDADFQSKYFEMLKAGGSKHHKELLKPFGLDASDPAFWDKGLSMISGFIDELETM